MTRIRYFFEAVGFYLLFGIFACLPARTASHVGGWLGKTIGPRLAASRKARRNLEAALPGIDDKDAVIAGMWENLGRVIAEYPHLKSLGRVHTAIEGLEHIGDDQCIFIAAHLGNWELNCIAPYLQDNLHIDVTYRAPNNPWVDRLLARTRSMGGALQAHAKSREGGMSLLKAIKAGRHIGILIDQKYNEGVEAAFFGRPAMTNPIFVQLAQKHNLKLLPVRNIRLEDGRFQLIVYPALNTDQAVEDVIKDAHDLLEAWIEDKPEQWLWLHRRWKE